MREMHPRSIIWQFLVVHCILLMLSCSSDALWSRCPRKCKCHSSWIRGVTTVEVDCSSKTLVRIPSIRDGLPRDVTKLILFKNYIQEIPKNAFRGLYYLKEVFLYENFITKIDKDAFRRLRRLKTLSLHHNRLTKIEDGTFKDLSNLQSLHLSSNFLEGVNSSTFSGLRRLKVLSLHENHLRCIPKGAFSPLGRLQFLSLNRNHLTEISSGVFCDSNSLLQLYLEQNKIQKIENNSFENCLNMVKLTIRYNRLRNLTHATFNGLTSLEELFLNNNYISSFPSHTFRELSKLKKLSLGSNKIQRIEKGTFAGLDGVLELALSGNKLSELLPNGFDGLPNLRILTLEDNSIIKIHTGAFSGLKNVATLYLYRNQLSNIPSHAFKGLDSLTELNLGVNRIASIENEAFFGMPVLLSLSLNSNRLTVIPAHAFKGLALLQKLTLYFNRIRYVAEGAFAPLKGLNVLSWNPPSSLMRFHPKLQTVQSNTLHCDCNAFWLQDWINSSKTLVPPKISCAAPERFKGKALMSIGKEDFPCDPFQVQVMPNRTYVLEGGSTSFKCTLLPGAVFTWVHNGKKIDVEDGDKYAAQQDGLLEINRISAEDEGTYICLAGNKAGLAAASATLSLGRTPLIIEQPEKEVTVATPGKSVLLPCKADGFPKPSIYWLKDGTRVKFNERVMQSADGSLVILNMEHSDEGIYSCLVANTFGTKDVSVRLYLSQGSMCLPSCRRDSGYCIAKYECQCLPGFEGPACEFRNNKVKSEERTASNNTIDGKAAHVPKQSSWVYDPLEMELHGESGDDDTEPDSDGENEKVVSDENSKVKLIINDPKPMKTRQKNVAGKLGTEVAPDRSARPDFQEIIRRPKPVNKRLPVNRIGRSPRVHALTTKLLVHKLLPKGG